MTLRHTLLLCLLWAATAGAATWTAQEGGSGVDSTANAPDNLILGFGMTLNYGASDTVYGGGQLIGFGVHGLMQFDLSTLPAGTVTAATLTVTVNQLAGSPSTSAIYRMRRTDWLEGTQNGGAGDSCWNNYKASTAWTTAGCGNTTNDYDTTSGVSGLTSPTSGSGTWDYTGLAALVTDAVASRGSILYLFTKLDSEAVDATYWSFCSSDNATAANRPKLTVTYTPAAAGAVPQRRMFMQ